MLIYIDIDNTITKTIGIDYSGAIPLNDKISIINDLYDKGHVIIYWTARGSKSGIDFKEITEKQLSRWGVKYHELKLGKPPYDLFIDDKTLNCVDLNKIEEFLKI